MTYAVLDGSGRLITEPQAFGSYIVRYGDGMVPIYSGLQDNEVNEYIYVTDLPIDPGGEESLLNNLTCFSPHWEAQQFVAIQDNAEYDSSEYTCIHRSVAITTQYVLNATQEISLVVPTTFTSNYKVRWKFRITSEAVARPLQYQNVLVMAYGYFQACYYVGIYAYLRLQEDVANGWMYSVQSMQENASFGGYVGLAQEGGGST
jgi:hypothetical protein